MIYCLHRTPWQLCYGVEGTFPPGSPRLVRRPFNHYDPDYTNWYLVPSPELPFFKFGKYHFAWDEKVRKEIRAGFLLTKGLDPMLKAAYPSRRGKRLLMDDTWAWPDFMAGVRSGAFEQAVRTVSACSGEPVLLEFSGGYIDDPGLFEPDQDYRKKDDYFLQFDPAADTVRVLRARRDAMCLRFLNQVRDFAALQKAFETLDKEAFLWCDVFAGVAFAIDQDSERVPCAGAADDNTLREAVLTPFANWVH